MPNTFDNIIIDGEPAVQVNCKGGSFIVDPEIGARLLDWKNSWKISYNGSNGTPSVTTTNHRKTWYLQHFILGLLPGEGRKKETRIAFKNCNPLDFRQENLVRPAKGQYKARKSTSTKPSLPSDLVGQVEPLENVVWIEEKGRAGRFQLLGTHPYMQGVRLGQFPPVDQRGVGSKISNRNKYELMVKFVAKLKNVMEGPVMVDLLPIDLPVAKIQTVEELDQRPGIYKCREFLDAWIANPSSFVLWKPCFRKLVIGCQRRFENESSSSYTRRQSEAKSIVEAILVQPERPWTIKLCNQLSKLERHVPLRQVVVDRPLAARIESFRQPQTLQLLENWKFEQAEKWIAKVAQCHLQGWTENASKTPLPTMKHLRKRHGLTKVEAESELEFLMAEHNLVSRATGLLFLREKLANDDELVAYDIYYLEKKKRDLDGYYNNLGRNVLRWKNSARVRKLEVQVDFEPIIQNPCLYCGEFGRNNSFSGVDRIDSDFGYLPNNVVPCCGFCNKAKLDHSVKVFLELVQNVVNYSNSKTTPEKLVIPRKHPPSFAAVNEGAKKRGLLCLLSLDQATNLFAQPCHYCGISDPNGSGIDRFVNSGGYTTENCVPSCWPCNHMKGTASAEFFIEKCQKISNRISSILDTIEKVKHK